MNNLHRDPIVHGTPILELRPTQMTVGMREVERKRKNWSQKNERSKGSALGQHMVPVVLGPGGERYITDHHHLARALFDDKQEQVFVTVIGDLSKADRAHFWNLMDYHGWTHPFDEKGRRCDYADLPTTVEGLRDDPYRALAGALRQAGGFAKDSTPFSEFVWADFFRSRIKVKQMNQNFAAAVREAYRMAKLADADYLPGWCGPHDSDPAPRKKKPSPRKRA